MTTCQTCAHYSPFEWFDQDVKITQAASEWSDAIDRGEGLSDHYDGCCSLAEKLNVYKLWLDGDDLPVVGVVEGSPMRTSSDGCCSSLHVKATFGCNAWMPA